MIYSSLRAYMSNACMQHQQGNSWQNRRIFPGILVLTWFFGGIAVTQRTRLRAEILLWEVSSPVNSHVKEERPAVILFLSLMGCHRNVVCCDVLSVVSFVIAVGWGRGARILRPPAYAQHVYPLPQSTPSRECIPRILFRPRRVNAILRFRVEV